MALSSGEYGGRNSGVRLAGTASCLAMCQPARSINTTAWASGCHRRAELVEPRRHRGSTDTGQDQGDPGVTLRADGAEPIDRPVAQIAHAARAHAALEPAPAQAPGLADPRLVLEPDLEPLSLGMVACKLGDQRWAFFLKRACAARSALGMP